MTYEDAIHTLERHRSVVESTREDQLLDPKVFSECLTAGRALLECKRTIEGAFKWLDDNDMPVPHH